MSTVVYFDSIPHTLKMAPEILPVPNNTLFHFISVIHCFRNYSPFFNEHICGLFLKICFFLNKKHWALDLSIKDKLGKPESLINALSGLLTIKTIKISATLPSKPVITFFVLFVFSNSYRGWKKTL